MATRKPRLVAAYAMTGAQERRRLHIRRPRGRLYELLVRWLRYSGINRGSGRGRDEDEDGGASDGLDVLDGEDEEEGTSFSLKERSIWEEENAGLCPRLRVTR
jgi:hypothetical protein